MQSIPNLIISAIAVMIVACVLLAMIGHTLDKILDLLREWYTKRFLGLK